MRWSSKGSGSREGLFVGSPSNAVARTSVFAYLLGESEHRRGGADIGFIELLISHGREGFWGATPRNTSENITRFESVPKDDLERARGICRKLIHI